MRQPHRKVLLIGATGQLGSQVMLRLHAAGLGFRVMVRAGSLSRLPSGTSAEGVTGDLLDRDSLTRALVGIRTVISTANAIIPSKQDAFGVDELAGYQNLVQCALAAGVRRVVFISAFQDEAAEGIPEFIVKRRIERLLHDSGLPHCVLRCSAFMDSYFPVVGSRLALRGSLNATAARPHWLQRMNQFVVGWPIDHGNGPVLPGDGRASHPYVALDDVADAVVSITLQETVTGTLTLSGPASISWAEIAQATREALGMASGPAPGMAPGPLRGQSGPAPRHVPAATFKALAILSRPFSPSGANLLTIMRYLSTHSLPPQPPDLAGRLAITARTAAEFLQAKAALLRPLPPFPTAAKAATSARRRSRP